LAGEFDREHIVKMKLLAAAIPASPAYWSNKKEQSPLLPLAQYDGGVETMSDNAKEYASGRGSGSSAIAGSVPRMFAFVLV
jgi:hypothetical protein